MFGTMYTAYSGLLANSTGINVTSNNLANINTPGFKRGEAKFGQLMSNLTQGSSGNGNPIQIGLGALNNQIIHSHTQGSIQHTGSRTHLALEGDGFFLTDRGGTPAFTRAGNFTFGPADDNNIAPLVTADGSVVQGFIDLSQDGTIDTSGTVGDITLDFDHTSPARQTSMVRLITNLSAAAEQGADYTTEVDVWDDQGNSYTLAVRFEKTANDGEWSYNFSHDGETLTGGSGTVAFDENGQLATVDGGAVADKALTLSGLENGVADFGFDWDLIDTDEVPAKGHITNYSQFSSTGTLIQDGFGVGQLQDIDFRPDGTMLGSYTNGAVTELARIAVAQFPNVQGLKQVNGYYTQTGASGEAFMNTNGSTIVRSGSLETSNVDIAEEFTSLIVLQRGFQSNSKAVMTTDQFIQEALGLKR